MAFTSILPDVARHPRSASRRTSARLAFQKTLLNNLSLSSWLLIGALLQSIILSFIPRLYAFIPIFLILGARFGHTLLVTYHVLPNPYLKDAIFSKNSAQVPDADGNFSDNSASQGVVCLHLGAKFNHPLGVFAPNAKQLGEHLGGMVRVLDSEAGAGNGYLGGSNFTSFDPRGATEVNFISYWRSIDAIHTFAYGPTHRAAWDWWNKLPLSGSQHIGINHEIFAAAPGQWEAIYLNFQPTLLGATTYLRKGDKLIGGTVEDKWISPLVDASKGMLKSSAGRLGWQPESLYKKFEHELVDTVYGKQG